MILAFQSASVIFWEATKNVLSVLDGAVQQMFKASPNLLVKSIWA